MGWFSNLFRGRTGGPEVQGDTPPPEIVGPPAPPMQDNGPTIHGSAPTIHASRFLACLNIVLRHEGGFVNDQHDPGGATNMGITLATLAAWRGQPVTWQDVRALTGEEAREIYRARYWKPTRCDDLPAGIDLMVFDFAVNAGTSAGAKMLQRAVGAKDDGVIGPVTVQAAGLANPIAAIDRMATLREAHYRSLPTFGRFGRGWLRRTEEVRLAAIQMAANA